MKRFCIYIFILPKRYHQVHNLEDTISINHNWGNGCNIDLFWMFLEKELIQVEREIDDCKSMYSTLDEWREQCQIFLKVNRYCRIDIKYIRVIFFISDENILISISVIQICSQWDQFRRVL